MNNNAAQKISTAEQMFFAQRMSLLLASGISIVEALGMMRNGAVSKSRKASYDYLIDSVQKGVSLSRAVVASRIRFESILISLIENGEASGHLSESLLHAYKHLEKKQEGHKKIISALIYPSFIVIATIGMTLFLIMYIFPKIIPLLKSLDIKLPLITRIVQALYYFLIEYGFWVGAGCAVFGMVMVIAIRRFYALRTAFHRLKLSCPIIGRLVKIHTLSSVCGMAETLLVSGKGVPDMLSFSARSSRNECYRELFRNMHKKSIEGVSLSALCKDALYYFPSPLYDMVVVGERTGNLAAMLGHCARIFEQDVDVFVKRFSALIEPVLMVLMGLIVGSIALSIILPVYEITNHLSN